MGSKNQSNLGRTLSNFSPSMFFLFKLIGLWLHAFYDKFTDFELKTEGIIGT